MQKKKYSEKIVAGVFSSWLRRIRYMLITNSGTTVPCGDCRACCRSYHFIHINTDEKDTVKAIPKKYLFKAPFRNNNCLIMGHLDNGYCPMLADDHCLIYNHRSQTCRNYDCRIFKAAGIPAGDKSKKLINEQLEKWEFRYPGKRDKELQKAVLAAVKFMSIRADCFPDANVPDDPSQIAILALKVYEIFLNQQDTDFNTISQTEGRLIAESIIKTNNDFELKHDKYIKQI